MRVRNFILILQMLLLGVFSALAHAQVVVTDDANTSSFFPTTNFGNSIALIVCSGSNTYIKFSTVNLGSGVTGSNVSKATLTLYVDAVLTSGTMDVYQVNGSWSEGKITYNSCSSAGNQTVRRRFRQQDRIPLAGCHFDRTGLAEQHTGQQRNRAGAHFRQLDFDLLRQQREHFHQPHRATESCVGVGGPAGATRSSGTTRLSRSSRTARSLWARGTGGRNGIYRPGGTTGSAGDARVDGVDGNDRCNGCSGAGWAGWCEWNRIQLPQRV
jgi:hypothetical protein